jgi:hypothetical protein
LQDDAKFGKALVDGFIEPYKKSWAEGKYFEVAGRATFDIGSLFIGAGEANAAIKTGEVASVAAKTAEVANVAGKTGEVASVASKTAEVANVASKTGEVANVTSKSGKAAEVASTTAKATERTTTVTAKAGKTAEAEVATARSSAKAGEETAAAGKGSASAKSEHSPHFEMERKLSEEKLPSVKDIPNDTILRAANPKEFLGNAVKYLDEHFPLTRDFRYRLLKDEEQISNIEKVWERKLLKRQKEFNITPEKARELSEIKGNPKAVTFHPVDEIAFLPETIKRMSGSIEERLAAFKTISHEWWHAMKAKKSSSFLPFEEGGADLFSEMVIHKRMGSDKISLNHSYGPLKEGAELLKNRFGEKWFLESRSASNGIEYLRKTFESAKFPKEKIDAVLGKYNVSSDLSSSDWLSAVKNLLASE